MEGIDYSPLIDGMRWSYSRIKAYEQCPYSWFLNYLLFPDVEGEEKFYASYGSFMHELLAGFYSGKLGKEDMLDRFLTEFQDKVKGRRPQGDLVSRYLESGVSYLSSFSPLPFSTVGVELEIRFRVGGLPFLGFIDHLGEKDGEYYITDNKSRDLLPRSGKAKPTAKDRELDDMLRQLYLYSVYVEETYGKPPKALCFNCFRTGKLIIEPFRQEAYEEAKSWALGEIEKIRSDTGFEPNENYFFCNWLCDRSGLCKYYWNREKE